MPMMKLNGETFHVKVDGPKDAPALVLSNSLSSNLSMWDRQIPEWSKAFRVVRYDTRGHGQSVTSAPPYSLAQLAGDALALMDALGIARANWCGLSMGGMVGQWLATHHPQRLNRVVLANTASRMGPPDLWNARIRTVSASGMEAIVDATLDRWLSKAFQERDKKATAAVRKMILGTSPQGYCGSGAAIRDMDQREAIRSIALPVLVVTGSMDPATPPAAGQFIQAQIKGAKLVELQAAHVSNIEQPEAFGKAVLEFLTAGK